MQKYHNLYNISEYTFLDSLIKIEELVQQSKEHGLKAVVLSDRNNMFGLGPLLKSCQEHGLKAILGVDLDVEKYRFILLARNYQGFIKINQLILKKSQNKEIKVDEIKDKNLYILDHPRYGYFAQTNDNKYSVWGNYFINSNDTNFSNSLIYRENRVFYKNDQKTLNILQKLNNLEETKEYLDYFQDVGIDPIFITRINKIIDDCNVAFPTKEMLLASYNNNDEKTNEKVFLDFIKKGVEKHQKDLAPYPDYQKRLTYEIEIIKKLGFINYFLIIQDLINWAKSKDISIGPGRGSAAGSLVSYLLNITTINPLRYGLLFERFLNPERVSWPDIDIDIQDDRRMEVFDYLTKKYGADHTALISTFQTIGAKMAVRDVGRILGLSSVVVNRISKSLDSTLSLKESYTANIEFRTDVDKYPGLYENALKIEGLPRQQGYHAAGFLICNKALSSVVPTCMSNDGDYQQVQIPMNYLEDFGLIKIDLLGLKTLTEIKNIEKLLPENQRFDYLVEKNPNELSDPTALMMLNNGYTEGIFQLESGGMKRTVQKVGLNSFDDLYAIISLFRPGPLAFIDEYGKNKRNPKLIPHVLPEYDAIVAPTYGIIVYQEQIMQLAQSVGQMSFAQADFLRRAISKKKEDQIKKYRELFYAGGYKKGLEIKKLNEIYNNIEKFASYGFNKSHAVCYAYLTMKMAYYKARYSLLYYASLISSSAGAQDTINRYINEIKEVGIPIYSPNILYSYSVCRILDNALYLPFELIKGFGNEGVNKIMADLHDNGPYKKNLIDTMLRLRFAGIKDAAMETLIKANVFRDFGHMKFILAADKQIKDIYNVLANYKSYKEAIKDIEKLGYLNMPLDQNIERDIEMEMFNEQSLLGNLYNAFATSAYESKYQHKMNDIKKLRISTLVPVEVVDIREPWGKEYIILELRDSSKLETFFVNKSTYSANIPLTRGQIVEANICYRNHKLALLSWKEIK